MSDLAFGVSRSNSPTGQAQNLQTTVWLLLAQVVIAGSLWFFHSGSEPQGIHLWCGLVGAVPYKGSAEGDLIQMEQVPCVLGESDPRGTISPGLLPWVALIPISLS